MIVTIFTTTGLALVILALINLVVPMSIPFSTNVIQIFVANIVIHLGLLLTKKFESQYIFLEALLDVVYTIAVLVFFGWVFDWFYVWFSPLIQILILTSMAIFIYMIASHLKLARIRDEVNEINKLLKERKKKTGNLK